MGIRGHTKNACDRTFNQMKLQIHESDVFSYQKLLDSLGEQDKVTILDTTEDMFFTTPNTSIHSITASRLEPSTQIMSSNATTSKVTVSS
jgi:mannitol-1-phosphate/altronate dehydrogenase